MKKMLPKSTLLFLILMLLFLEPIKAQAPFGNEWINYNQKYFKIKVWNNGVYQINRNTLSGAIPELSTIDPRQFQLFGQGKEVPLWIQGEEDGVFDENDVIEFFGFRNTGWLDTRLYPEPNDQTNKVYSLFTDTAVYYLTWNNSTQNLRYQIETDNAFGSYGPASAYHFAEVYNQAVNRYYFGRTDAIGGTDPEYTTGEGWSGNILTAPINNQLTNIPTPFPFTGGPPARFEIHYKTVSNSSVFLDHRYQLNIANQTIDTLIEGHGTHRFVFSIPASSITSPNTAYRFSYLTIPGVNVSNSVYSNYTMRYAHTWNMENRAFYRLLLPDNEDFTKHYVNFSNFNASGNPPRIYDITNGRIIQPTASGANFNALIPNGQGLKEIFVVSQSQIINIGIANFTPVNYNGSEPGKFNDLSAINGAEFLMVYHKILGNAVNEYQQYRQQKYNTLAMDIDELYDQFSYGILKHPLAIRNFVRFGLNAWNQKPEYLLLLGKAVSGNHLRLNATLFSQCLVPTFGYPPADNLFTNGLGGTSLWEPALATGRIAANNPGELLAYLNKLQQYETLPPAMWQKQVLHFGGGSSANEQLTFRNYLRGYQRIIEDTLFGAVVDSFFKTSAAPIQQGVSAQIAEYINNGVALMTFFGHATGNGFDVSLDDPANYNNTNGKYPFLLGNSCYAGDIHLPPGLGFSKSEEFTLIPNRGTIGFIASVGLGVPSQLHIYTDTLYSYFGNRYYGKPMAYCMKKTIGAVQTNDPYRKAVCLETTLHGDPAVAIFNFDKPDYFTTAPDVYFNPSVVSTEADSFKVNIIISNLGRAISQPLTVEVRRTLPDGQTTELYNREMSPVFNRDTLTIAMPLDPVTSIGLNQLAIRIDPLNAIDESNELNNDLITSLFIAGADIVPVWPPKFAVIPNNTQTLKASTGNPFAPVQSYIFELDTTDLFNSPFKLTHTVNAPGGVITWTPALTFPDSAVYFWRTARQPNPGDEIKWHESSFQYIEGKRGWSQDHFFQFKDNSFNLIDYNRNERKFEFIETARLLSAFTYGFPWTQTELWNTSYKIDTEVMADAGCSLDPAIYLAVIDSVTLRPWQSPEECPSTGNQFGQFNNNCNCKGEPMRAFVFRMNNTGEMNALRNMINSQIPNGHYVLAYSWIRGMYQTWDNSLHEAFESLGAQHTRLLPNDYPYIFFAKKGYPASAIEVLADSANDNLTLYVPLSSSWVSGDFTSVRIGPGSQWDTLSYKIKGIDSQVDSIRIQLRGIRPDGSKQTLLNATAGPDAQFALPPIIDNQVFPFLELNAFMRDEDSRTPLQLDRWQVTFQPSPEIAVNPQAGFYTNKDTLQQGDWYKAAVAIQNISDIPTDSVLVHYWVIDENRITYPVPYPRQRALQPNEFLFDTIQVHTLPYIRLNTFFVEANPNYDQREQYRFNNFGQWDFFITGDKINPLMDVTFDGVHILNGDIVSPRPFIQILLKDENPYLPLEDTTAFQVFLRLPGQNSLKPIFFAQHPDMQFIPASLPQNKCRIEWRPHFIDDGRYDLIVKAKDVSGNKSGSVEYRIQFEVVNKSSITQVMNWPNPFSTRTHFVFTLTGTEIPDDFRIQIMTVTGRVVREISRSELGEIRIGRNITQYAWDGKDDFGDQLANGLYFYRVYTKINGEMVERRESAADRYFERGLGKMYLMR